MAGYRISGNMAAPDTITLHNLIDTLMLTAVEFQLVLQTPPMTMGSWKKQGVTDGSIYNIMYGATARRASMR